MKIFRKPNPWFAIFFLVTLLLGPTMFILHILTFGCINGLGIVDRWVEYTVDKDFKWDTK